MIRIKTNAINDIISKGKNGGKLGLFTEKFGIKRSMPDIVKTQDFPANFKLKTRRANYSKEPKGTIMPRIKYQQVKFKEEQVNMSGKESSIADNFEFQNEKPLVYDPFANAAGYISEMGGFNKGGAEEFSQIKQNDKLIKPKYKLETKKTAGIRKITNPEAAPPVLAPGIKVKSRTTIKIR